MARCFLEARKIAARTSPRRQQVHRNESMRLHERQGLRRVGRRREHRRLRERVQELKQHGRMSRVVLVGEPGRLRPEGARALQEHRQRLRDQRRQRGEELEDEEQQRPLERQRGQLGAQEKEVDQVGERRHELPKRLVRVCLRGVDEEDEGCRRAPLHGVRCTRAGTQQGANVLREDRRHV